MSAVHLNDLIAEVQNRLFVSQTARSIIDDLVSRGEARLRFTAGTYEVRLAGIVATCTESEACALQAWLRKACAALAGGRA